MVTCVYVCVDMYVFLCALSGWEKWCVMLGVSLGWREGEWWRREYVFGWRREKEEEKMQKGE